MDTNYPLSSSHMHDDILISLERPIYVKYLSKFSILALLISLYQIIVPILALVSHYTPTALFHLIAGIFTFFAIILILYWCSQVKKVHSIQTILKSEAVSEILTTTVYLFSMLISGLSLILLGTTYTQLDLYGDYYTAQNRTNLISAAWWLPRVLLPLEAFMFVYFLASARAAFRHLGLGEIAMRWFIHISSVFLFALALTQILFAHYTYKYMDYFPIANNFSSYTLNALFGLGIAFAIIAFLLFFVNLRRYRVGYFVIFCLLVIAISISAITVGFAFRSSRHVYQDYSKSSNCASRMSSLNEADIQSHGCPAKYLYNSETNQIQTSCPNDQIGTYWEQDLNKLTTAQLHQPACLNIACCGLVGDLYANYLNLLSIISLGSCIAAAFCAVGCYYFWFIHFETHEQRTNSKEFIWLILMVICLIVFILLITLVTLYLPNQNGNNVQAKATPTQDIIALNPSQFGDQASYPIENFNVDYDTTLCPESDCTGYNLLIALLASNSNFNFESVPSSLLTYFDPSTKTNMFPSAGVNDGFIAMYGTPSAINSAISTLQVYPNIPQIVTIQVLRTQTNGQSGLSTTENGALSTSLSIDASAASTQVIKGRIESINPNTGAAYAVQGATISATRVNGYSLGSSASSSGDGSFSWTFNTFKNNQPYTAVLSVSASGYLSASYDYQIGGLPNVGTIDIGTIYLLPSSRILSQDKLSLAFDGSYQQRTLYTFNITFADAISQKPVQGASVELYQTTDSSQFQNIRPWSTAVSAGNGNALFNNFKSGYYSINAQRPGYVSYVQPLVIFGNTQGLQIPFVSNVKSNQLVATLEWFYSLELDFMATFNADTMTVCQVDSTLGQCGGLVHANDNAIELTQWGPYNYLFFVRKSLGTDLLGSQSTQSASSVLLPDSGAVMKVYVDTITTQPAFTFHVPSVINANNDNNLIWLGFCVNGNQGPSSIIPLNEYWSPSSNGPYTPTADICNQYYPTTTTTPQE